jgi:chemotaxis protein methyltransferase CheR
VTTADDSARTKTTSLGYGDYLRFSKLVYERCGLHFPDNRRADLERGVRQAFAVSTCTDIREYYDLLQDPNSSAVHFEQLINAITISETHFFRDAGQVDALYNHVLPWLIERRRTLRTLRIWSAGCSSGEEPYSIAILLRELLPNVDEWSITIIGTDINTEAIDRARQAVYSEWAFREERAKQWQARYFHRRGNHYELSPVVRRMVTLGQFNLVEDNYPSYESNTTLMDLILCRNVMIYFTEDVSRSIVDRFYSCLTYGGWLVVGHAEHSLTIYRRFQVHNFPNAILYQRTDEVRSPAKVQPLGKVQPLLEDWQRPPSAPHIAASKERVAPISTPSAKKRRYIEPELDIDLRPEPELEHVYIHALGRLGHVDPLERAKELLGYGRSEEALDLLQGLYDTGSKDAAVCALLGQAHANMGSWDEAERWCRQAIQQDKLSLNAYYILALVLQHQEKFTHAIEMMKKVVYIDRHHILGHFGLANLYRNDGQLAQALKSLDNARHLLEGCADDESIPGSGGITASSLRETIIHQQQKWGAEAADL